MHIVLTPTEMNHTCNEYLFLLGCHGSIIPRAITCFNCVRFDTLPQFVLSTAGFNLSCSNSPLKSFPSSVISR